MEYIKSWIVSICTTVFFITAVEMILPNNNIKKYAKFVLGLILMTVVINPLVKFLNNGSGINAFINNTTKSFEQGYNSKNESYEEKNTNKTLDVFKTNLEKVCVKKLKEKYPQEDCKAEAKVSLDKETNEVVIDTITLTVSSNTVKSVKKVEVKRDSESVDQSLDESKHAKEIKQFVKDELGISENKVKVYSK